MEGGVLVDIRRRTGLWLMALAVLLLPGSLRAFQVQPLPLETLVNHAEAIVRVRVETVTPELRSSGQGVLTRVHARVIDWYHNELGEGAAFIEIIQGGGQVGDLFERPLLDARFRAGQERVLFLRRTPAGAWLVLGILQGVYDVVHQPVDAKSMKSPEPLIKRALGIASSEGQPDALLSLPDFEARLRGCVAMKESMNATEVHP
jgi:hypothetical protein